MKKYTATLKDNSNLKGRKLNLQLFADDNTDTNNQDTSNNDNKDNKDTKEPKSYTQEELDKLLQAESDRRVSEALKTAKIKWDKELEEKLDNKIKEAEKLAKMSEKEKQDHLLKEKEKEIAEKERTLASRELKLTAIDILTEKKIPITLVDILLPASLDANETKENIDKFEKAFRDEVEKAVKERLAGPTPKGGGNGSDISLGSDIAKQRNETKTTDNDPWK